MSGKHAVGNRFINDVLQLPTWMHYIMYDDTIIIYGLRIGELAHQHEFHSSDMSTAFLPI